MNDFTENEIWDGWGGDFYGDIVERMVRQWSWGFGTDGTCMFLARKKVLPIGVDLGSSAAKMLQLRIENGRPELFASDVVSVPPHLHRDQLGRLDYLLTHMPQAIKRGKFKGKKCILALPSADTFVRHVRVPKRDAAATKEAVLREVGVELPYPVEDAALRHIIAGEVYEGGEVRQEVIVVAMPMSTLKAYLNMFTKIGLEVLSVSVEPVAMLNCFCNFMPGLADKTTVFLDLGYSGTQVTIVTGQDIQFSRMLYGGADHMNRAISQALKISTDEVQQMRMDLQYGKNRGAAGAEVEQWIDLWVEGIHDDIENCLRYYEAAFRGDMIEQVVFAGGQSQDRRLCEKLARRVGLPAQIGNAMALLRQDGTQTSRDDMFDEASQYCMAVAAGLSLAGVEH